MRWILLIELCIVQWVMLNALRADATLDVPSTEVFDSPSFFPWNNNFWSPQQPTASCSVEILAATDEFGLEVELVIELDAPVTVQSLSLEPRVEVDTFGNDLSIGGNFTNNGTLRMRGNTALNVTGDYSGIGTIAVTGENNAISVDGTFELGPVQTEVVQDAEISIDADVLNQGSLVATSYNSEFDVTGTYIQNGSTIDTGLKPPPGVEAFVLRALSQLFEGGATVQGNGRLEAPQGIVFGSGWLFPGRSPGTLTVVGNLTLGEASELGIEVGGTLAGAQYDVVAQSGGDAGVQVAGRLSVTMIDGFAATIDAVDTFAVVTSDLPISGAFSNVASGSRIWTTGGEGTFLVDYGVGSGSPNTVRLSDFVAATPATTSYTTWATSMNLPAGKDGPYDDADANGEVNLLAYFGGSPAGIPFAIESRGTAQVAIAEIATYVDNEYRALLETSSDPSPQLWSDAEGARIMGRTDTKVLWEIPLPADKVRQFLRVRIEPLAVGS